VHRRISLDDVERHEKFIRRCTHDIIKAKKRLVFLQDKQRGQQHVEEVPSGVVNRVLRWFGVVTVLESMQPGTVTLTIVTFRLIAVGVVARFGGRDGVFENRD
jgi:hypothetical protein